MAKTTFSGPVHSLNGFVGDLTSLGPLKLASFTASELPNAEDHEGALVYVSDEKAVMVSDGDGWVKLEAALQQGG